MDWSKITIKITYKIISDCNGLMTVAFFVGDKLCHVVSGDRYEMLHSLENVLYE